VRADEFHGADISRAHTNSLDIQTRKTRVRVLWEKTKAGIMSNGKAHHNAWTQESYLVLDREGPNSWIIDVPKGEVKVWATHSIQIAPEDERVSTLKSTKTVPAVVKAQRLEELSISAAEQKEALSGPKRSTRARKVNYA